MDTLKRIIIAVSGYDRYLEGKRISQKKELEVFVVEEPDFEVMGRYENKEKRYSLYISEDGFFCTCADNMVRQNIFCKHLIGAVLRVVMMGYKEKIEETIKKLILGGKLCITKSIRT